jgi:hypothetical protein
VNALADDENYFPCLEVVRIEPEEVIYGDEPFNYGEAPIETQKHPFTAENLAALEAYCRRRNITLRKDAVKTMSYPRHF